MPEPRTATSSSSTTSRVTPKHLAYADLLGPAPRGEGSKAEQAEAGNEYRDADKDAEHLSLSFSVAWYSRPKLSSRKCLGTAELGSEGARPCR